MFETNYRKDVTAATQDMDFTTKKYRLTLATNKGDINLEFFPDVAPEHCKNMLGLAKIGFYDNLKFHRVIEGFVIQGGCPRGNGTGGPGYQVRAEFNDRPHKAGVVSMARAQHPDSAGSQFFICLGDVPHLDGQYTVFGQTCDAESLAVVASIGQVETGAEDRPREDVVIHTARVTEMSL